MSPTKKDPFTIPDTELAKELAISSQYLDQVVDFFDSDPNDSWDLLENVDYILSVFLDQK